jgi:hypothetical protein
VNQNISRISNIVFACVAICDFVSRHFTQVLIQVIFINYVMFT